MINKGFVITQMRKNGMELILIQVIHLTNGFHSYKDPGFLLKFSVFFSIVPDIEYYFTYITLVFLIQERKY